MSRILKALSPLCASAAVSLSAYALSEAERAAIEERIRPVGEVCLEGDDRCGAAAAAAAASSSARSGEQVYDTFCMACHSTGVGEAPILGDSEAWAERIAKGMDALYEAGILGIAGTTMLARGGCMDCSDEEIAAAVDFMVEGSQ